MVYITRISSQIPVRLAKRYYKTAEGAYCKDSAGYLVKGSAEVIPVDFPEGFRQMLMNLKFNEALVAGRPNLIKEGPIEVVTKNSVVPDTSIARSREYFTFSHEQAIFTVDYDPQDDTEVKKPEEVLKALREAIGTDADAVWLPSGSSYIYDTETEEMVHGLHGQRFYFLIDDATKIPELGRRLFKKLFLNGYGWVFITAAGTMLPRTIADCSIYTPEHLDFAAGAFCEVPLEQRRGEPVFMPGTEPMITRIPDFTDADEAAYQTKVRMDKEAVRDTAMEIRRKYISEKIESLPTEKREHMRRILEMALNDKHPVLMDDFTIEVIFEDGHTKCVTVEQILKKKDSFDGMKTILPFEPEYPAKAFMCLQKEEPCLMTFAHGGMEYRLLSTRAFRDEFNQTKTSDLGNVERFETAACNDAKYVNGRGWGAYNGAKWNFPGGDSQGIHIYTERVAKGAIYSEINNYPLGSEGRNQMIKWAQRSESASSINNAINLAKTSPVFLREADDFNQDRYLFNVINGTIDLKTGALKPHNSADYITQMADVVFDPKATAPIWQEFLQKIFNHDNELIDFVQRAVGYTLTGLCNSESWFFCYGTGANGKSTFANTLLHILGDYGLQTAPNLLMKTQTGNDRHPTEIASLYGRRFALAQESDDGHVLGEGSIKRITSTDKITARRMREDFFSFWPTHKIWLCTNNKPKVTDTTDGTWRRICFIPFEVTIPENERDPLFGEKLLKEASGILNWGIEGCISFQQMGLLKPQKVIAAVNTYRYESDTIGRFITEYTDADVNNMNLRCASSEIFKAYTIWAEQEEEAAVSQKKFSTSLIARGFQNYKENGRQHFRGITLKDNAKAVVKALS